MQDATDRNIGAQENVAKPIICPSWCNADHTGPDGWVPDIDGTVMHRHSFPGVTLPHLSWIDDGDFRNSAGWELAVEQGAEAVDKPETGHPMVFFAPSDDLYLTGGDARSLAAALIRAANLAEGLSSPGTA